MISCIRSFLLFLIILLVDLSFILSMSQPTNKAMKRILVTGGNKGIGKAICERLLTEWKDTHVIMGSRSLERGQQAVKDISSKLSCPERLTCLQLDTSSDASVEQAAQELVQQGLTPLYGIINNAGVRISIYNNEQAQFPHDIHSFLTCHGSMILSFLIIIL